LDTDFDQLTLKVESRDWVSKLRSKLIELFRVADSIHEKNNGTAFVLLAGGSYPECKEGENAVEAKCYPKGKITDAKALREVMDNASDFYNFFGTVAHVRKNVAKANDQLLAIKSYVLPMLLGMLGACTFVVRNISDAIKDATFSRASPLRHALRVGLGAIVGVVVVTFYGVPDKASAAAWGFIAGYAMESVFATFEFVVGKLKS
jgi:hypothetical protein